MSDTIVAGLPMIKFTELRDYIAEKQGELLEEERCIPVWAVADKLITLNDLFAGGTPAMYRFMMWGKANGETDGWILSTILHDLYGMKESGFSPRTSSY
jgi:hypothetical protein